MRHSFAVGGSCCPALCLSPVVQTLCSQFTGSAERLSLCYCREQCNADPGMILNDACSQSAVPSVPSSMLLPSLVAACRGITAVRSVTTSKMTTRLLLLAKYRLGARDVSSTSRLPSFGLRNRLAHRGLPSSENVVSLLSHCFRIYFSIPQRVLCGRCIAEATGDRLARRRTSQCSYLLQQRAASALLNSPISA